MNWIDKNERLPEVPPDRDSRPVLIWSDKRQHAYIDTFTVVSDDPDDYLCEPNNLYWHEFSHWAEIEPPEAK